ncbi:Protein of unknown function [Gryllus bimaculatus]|nr:Protein of unknown function [Gryllus bimaculatus]
MNEYGRMLEVEGEEMEESQEKLPQAHFVHQVTQDRAMRSFGTTRCSEDWTAVRTKVKEDKEPRR